MKKKKNSLGEAVVVGSALAGAALGAAAVMLSDKKNQAKIRKTVDDISDEAVKIGKTLKEKASTVVKAMADKEETVEKKVKKEVVKKVEKEVLKKASPTVKKIYTTAKPVVKAATKKK